MLLKDIIQAAQYKISSGDDYGWKCYGENARFLDFSSQELCVEASCIFDTQTQEVYEVSLYLNDKAYRRLNPKTMQAMHDESFARDLDPRVYVDNSHFVDLELDDDMLEKITSAFTTGTCSDDIVIALDLTPELEQLFANLPEGMSIQDIASQGVEEKVKEIMEHNAQMWQNLASELSQSGITLRVDLKAPLLESVFEEIKNQIIASNKPELNLSYSDKLTAQGLEYSLRDNDFEIKYFLA